MLEYKNKDISGRSNPNKQRFYMYVCIWSVLFISLYEWRFFCSRMMSVYIWRPSVRVWSCRAFRLTRCPGLRREPCCNKRSASINATSSSSTWSSGGSLCTGGSDARKTLETTRCTQRWVRQGFCGLTFYLSFYRWNDSLHFFERFDSSLHQKPDTSDDEAKK